MKQLGYILIGLFCLTACNTQVELCDLPVHPHQYELTGNVTYEWGDIPEDERPDSMYIFANRIFNTIRYQFSYNLLTEEGHLLKYLPNRGDTPTNEGTPKARNGEITGNDDTTGTGNGETTGGNGDTAGGEGTTDIGDNLPEGEGPAEDDDTQEEPEVIIPTYSDFSVRAGQYQLLTINHSEAFGLDSLDAFMGNTAVKSSVLGITYYRHNRPYYDQKEVNDWTDFNQGYDFIQDAGGVYYDMQTANTEKSGNLRITFRPNSITQKVTFNFNIQLQGEYMDVDSVRGEVSGVCPGLRLFTNYLDMDAVHSCRMFFVAETNKSSLASDSIVRCSATVNVPSIINSEDENMKTGPGIIYLGATVSAKKIDDKGKETTIRKTCFAGINLRKYLLAQPLTKLTDGNGIHHVITEPEVVIDIEPIFPITLDEVLDSTNPEGNINYWFQEEGSNGDHDIEI